MVGALVFTLFVLQVTTAKKESSCFDYKSHCNGFLLDYEGDCGTSLELSDRIMGGKDAALGEFPWIARLFYRKEDSVETLCGGSIISEQYILTAAHCCIGSLEMELTFVRLGDYDNRTDEDCYRGHCAPPHVDIEVEKIISHDEFHPVKLVHDICLLRLKKKILFTDYKKPICLPTECKIQRKDYRKETLVAAGWGDLDSVDGRHRDVLQKISLQAFPPEKCKRKWKEFHQNVTPSNICAGVEVGEDVCAGDSGGPLMFRSPKGKYYLSGLVSYGLPCSKQSKLVIPGVYTKISSYLEWILDNMEE